MYVGLGIEFWYYDLGLLFDVGLGVGVVDVVVFLYLYVGWVIDVWFV